MYDQVLDRLWASVSVIVPDAAGVDEGLPCGVVLRTSSTVGPTLVLGRQHSLDDVKISRDRKALASGLTSGLYIDRGAGDRKRRVDRRSVGREAHRSDAWLDSDALG